MMICSVLVEPFLFCFDLITIILHAQIQSRVRSTQGQTSLLTAGAVAALGQRQTTRALRGPGETRQRMHRIFSMDLPLHAKHYPSSENYPDQNYPHELITHTTTSPSLFSFLFALKSQVVVSFSFHFLSPHAVLSRPNRVPGPSPKPEPAPRHIPTPEKNHILTPAILCCACTPPTLFVGERSGQCEAMHMGAMATRQWPGYPWVCWLHIRYGWR